MKRIDVQGVGVWIEIYKRKEEMTDLEILKEALKSVQRELIKRETKEKKYE